MGDNNNTHATTPTSSIGVIFERMKLTDPDDPDLFPKIQHWVKEQRPEFTPTTVFAMALLLQRLARAFACRSTGSTASKPTTSSSTAMTGTATSKSPASEPATQISPAASTSGVAATTPSTTQSTGQTVAPESNSASHQPSSGSNKSKKKPFRSIKKLDLSPKVCNALQGFVEDLASCTSLILREVEYEVYRDTSRSAAPGQIPKGPTAVDILNLCVKLLEGKSNTFSPIHSSSPRNKENNAAMELFRTILAEATAPHKNTDGTHSSVMDELKFKTFSLKVLESALEHTIINVESYYDYRLIYNVAHEQHSVAFIPLEKTEIEQRFLIWKLACYIVWKRHEDHPSLCTRKQRLMASAAAMVILSTLPLLHRHPEPSTKRSQTMTSESASGPAIDKTNPVTDDVVATKINPTRRIASTAEEPRTNSTVAGSSKTLTDGEGDDNKRSPTAGPGEGMSTKKQKVWGDGDISDGVPKESSAIAVDSMSTGKEGRMNPTTCCPQPDCSYCLKQERTLQIIVHATKQACSFLSWALATEAKKDPRRGDSSVEVSRAELDGALNDVLRDLQSFSDVPPFQYKNEDDEDSPFAWLEMLQNSIGLKEDPSTSIKTAESELLALLDRAFAAMQATEEGRRGTRVEAVHYTRESILAKGGTWEYMDSLCPTIQSRRKRENEFVACIPYTDIPTADESENRTIPSTKSFASRSGRLASHSPVQMNPRLLMMDEAHNKLICNNRAVSPPLVTESMELNEWTIAVLASLTSIKPSPNLRERLDAAVAKGENAAQRSSSVGWVAVIVPLLNRFLARMRHAAGGPTNAPLPLVVDNEGEVQASSRTQDTQLWASIIQIYYHSLESILYFERERLDDEANAKLVFSESFHEALLACSYLCILRAVTVTGKMEVFLPRNHQIYTIMPVCGCTPYAFLKVTESFLRALTSTIGDNEVSKKLTETFGTLPRILQKEVKTSEVHVIESLLWVRDGDSEMPDGSIVDTIAELKQSRNWPPECLEPTLPEEVEDLGSNPDQHRGHGRNSNHPEFVFVSFVVRKVLKISYYRIQEICRVLKIPMDYPIASQIWLAFRFLLRNHVELLYGRHIDQWILCTVYGVCKIMKYEPDITFARIIDVYVDIRGKHLGVGTCQAIVRHVKILDGAGDENETGNERTTKMGDIIRLYNLVFVPIMKGYMLHSESIKRNAAVVKKVMEDKGKSDGAPDEAVNDNNHSFLDQCKGPSSVSVQEGNVSIQVMLGSGELSKSSVAPQKTTTQMMMIDQQENDLAGDNIPGALPLTQPKHRTFLQFGCAAGSKKISLANEMIAQASMP